MYTFFVFVLLILPPVVTAAEIYQWRDEKGKLHFGDTPPESEQSEQVDLAPINTADTVKVDPTRKRIEENEKLIQAQQKRDESGSLKKKRALSDKCKKIENDYIDLKWGKSATAEHTVLTDDNGKAISRKKQNELAEKLRKDANARGCHIKFKKW
ncbi:MAG: DUF4124 domain-containing protein [Agarilytica sp.]